MDASRADVVIACMGLSPQMEGEEGDAIESPVNGDRTDIALPAVQADYLRLLKANGARLVLVLTGGSAIALGDVADLADAILFVWYPGQEGGRAVADVLFGTASPSGKLPLTFPRALDQLPPFEDYAMTGRTYRYATVEPQFPFGFGLSYTRFSFSDLSIAPSQGTANDNVTIAVEVANVGERSGDEVVQLYTRTAGGPAPQPLQELRGFQRLTLAPGERQTVTFTLPARQLGSDDGHLELVLEPATVTVMVGNSSQDLPLTGTFTIAGPHEWVVNRHS
jgi:beta-glucosidase